MLRLCGNRTAFIDGAVRRLFLPQHLPPHSTVSPSFPHKEPTPSFHPTRDMADQSRTSRFQTQFESALQSYQRETGVTLAEHSLAIKLQSCHSVESIITLLQNEARAFSDLPRGGIVMKSIQNSVSILSAISGGPSLDEAIDLPLFPIWAIYTGLGILLDAAKSVISSFNVLVDLLESIEHFLKRLDIYTRIPATPTVDEIMVKILVELLTTLALATRELKRGQSIKFVKKTFGENDVDLILKRLDRLTKDEARSTAAQVLDVIHGLVQGMRVIMGDGKASIEDVREALEILHQVASDLSKSKRDKLQQDMCHWLSPPDPWKNYDIARKSRHGETGAWLVQGDTLSQWKASVRGSLLWIHGKPGSGKSVICSKIIEEIETMRKSGLASPAMFYHDFREAQKKDLRGLLSSVLVQLCHQSDSYCAILSKLYSEHGNGSQRPSDRALVCCFNNMVNLPQQAPIFLIVDALDECPNTYGLPSPREEVLRLIRDLVDSQLPNLHICVTSRPEADIQSVLDPLAFRCISLHDEYGQMEDIENFIKSIVNTDTAMRRWRLEDKQLVIDTLTKRADGMFLWVYCQLECLRKRPPGSIRHTLNELPETLDGTYERILREINKSNWEFARRLLLCVSAAYHPFRVEELAEFLAFDFEASLIPKYREDWRPEDPVQAVLSTCSPLLTLVNVNESSVIQFSHFAVKEFLTSSRICDDTFLSRYHLSITSGDILVAQACLGILLHLDENITRHSLVRFPLAEYAAKHCIEHTHSEGISQAVEEGMKQLFDPGKLHFVVWLWLHDPIQMSHERAERPSSPLKTPLHYAAFFGLRSIVKFLVLEHSQDVNSPGIDDGSTPLHLALQNGHAEVARFLVEHGACTTSQNRDGSTPLHWSSETGLIDLWHILVEHGADVTAKDNFGSTPLHQASLDGNLDFVRFLVVHGAPVTTKDQCGSTPLHHASFNRHLALARFLVEHGADASAKDKDGLTPLHHALEKGKVNLALFLIQCGADATAQDKDGSTPLHLASERGHVELVRLLLKHGADVTAQDKLGLTPLHRALEVGNVDLALLLIKHGADARAQDKHGSTPLHRASERGNVDLARLFLENGADATAQDKLGSTPLHFASFNGHLDIARSLVEYGANATAQDQRGRTPLHHTSLNGHVNLARFLVKHGADVTVQDEEGWSPLHQVSQYGHLYLAQFLVEHGADVSAKDKDGSTPLHRALEGGNVDLSWLLLGHGANVAAQDKLGSTPLHQASLNGHLDLARLLADHGADLMAQDEDGSTPLHRAIQGGNLDLARFLVEHSADATAQDRLRSTPLHHASFNGHLDLARFLVEHGADVTVQDQRGWTPLHQASLMGHVDLARFLVDLGAHATAQDKYGLTPLHHVSRYGHLDLACFLVEHGANVTAQDQCGSTPLHQASFSGHLDLAQFLIGHGADPMAQDRHRSTPLHQASFIGHVGLSQFLVEHGADVRVQDKRGSTPLHWASRYDHMDLARILVEHGADATVQDRHGSTPLCQASRYGHEDLVRFLAEHAAEATARSAQPPTFTKAAIAEEER